MMGGRAEEEMELIAKPQLMADMYLDYGQHRRLHSLVQVCEKLRFRLTHERWVNGFSSRREAFEFGKVVLKGMTYDERTTGDLVDSKPLLRIAIRIGSSLISYSASISSCSALALSKSWLVAHSNVGVSFHP
jgi:signal recognition particle GTPase